jgi:hypothetical protein
MRTRTNTNPNDANTHAAAPRDRSLAILLSLVLATVLVPIVLVILYLVLGPLGECGVLAAGLAIFVAYSLVRDSISDARTRREHGSTAFRDAVSHGRGEK